MLDRVIVLVLYTQSSTPILSVRSLFPIPALNDKDAVVSTIHLAQARLDVGSQLVESLELAGCDGQLVVEWRQRLLLELLDRGRCFPRRAVG